MVRNSIPRMWNNWDGKSWGRALIHMLLYFQIGKEPEPIPNFLQKDDDFAKFMELKQLMNQVAKQKGQQGSYCAQAYPTSIELITIWNFAFQSQLWTAQRMLHQARPTPFRSNWWIYKYTRMHAIHRTRRSKMDFHFQATANPNQWNFNCFKIKKISSYVERYIFWRAIHKKLPGIL